MTLIFYIVGFYLLMMAIGAISWLLKINTGIIGTVFNISLMLFRKIWPIVVTLFIVGIIGGSLGWF